MHRTSAKKLVRKVRLNHRAPRRRIRLSLKKPRVAQLESLRSSLPEQRANLKKLPANGLNGHSKAEPRFLSDTALANAEHLFGSIKSQSGGDLSEKIKDLIRLAREQGYLTFDDVHEALP